LKNSVEYHTDNLYKSPYLPTVMNLHNLSWPDSEKYLKKHVVLLPVGSLEQHGLHNQLGCDFMIAEKLASAAASRKEILVCPPIPYGISKHHRHFFGTVWIEGETFRKYVLDVCLSLATHGAHKIIIVNGHGGNTSSLLEVVGEMRHRGVACIIFEWWKVEGESFLEEGLFGKEFAKGGHADAGETSVNMYLHPTLVNLKKARDRDVVWSPKVHGGQFKVDTIDFTDIGSIGFPTKASHEAGKKIFENAVEELTALIEWIEKENVKNLLEKRHK